MDRENIRKLYRWGEQRKSSFAINKSKFPRECNEYKKLLKNIIIECKKLSGNWSINCFLRGYLIENSLPTIVIVYESMPNNWKKPFTGSIPLEMIKGNVSRCRNMYEKKPCNSSCIGLKNNNSCGSFGGYLREKTSGIIYGLTCGHVVNLDDKKLDSTLELYQPAPYHVKQQKKRLEEQENEANEQKYAKDIIKQIQIKNKNLNNLVEKSKFGKIIKGEVCIPINTSYNDINSVYDWALIKFDNNNYERIGTNLFSNNPYFMDKNYNVFQPKVCSIEDCIKVWHSGHISTSSEKIIRVGKINGLYSICFIKGLESSEKAVLPESVEYNIVNDGDSGAWFMCKDGICGVITGKSSGDHTICAYISDFQRILDRIKDYGYDLELLTEESILVKLFDEN